MFLHVFSIGIPSALAVLEFRLCCWIHWNVLRDSFEVPVIFSAVSSSSGGKSNCGQCLTVEVDLSFCYISFDIDPFMWHFSVFRLLGTTWQRWGLPPILINFRIFVMSARQALVGTVEQQTEVRLCVSLIY